MTKKYTYVHKNLFADFSVFYGAAAIKQHQEVSRVIFQSPPNGFYQLIASGIAFSLLTSASVGRAPVMQNSVSSARDRRISELSR